MANNCDQTCQFTAITNSGAVFLASVSAMKEWSSENAVPMPIPSLTQYAEDIDPKNVVALDQNDPLQQAIVNAKTQANFFPAEVELGVCICDTENNIQFIPSKGYIAYLQEYQWLKWISEMGTYHDQSWYVIFTSNWSPVYDYFRFLGLMGIEVSVDYFDEFLEFAGDYQYTNHKGIDHSYDGDEGYLYFLKKSEWSVEDAWFLNVTDHNSFEEYSKYHEHYNPELITLIKKYYETKKN